MDIFPSDVRTIIWKYIYRFSVLPEMISGTSSLRHFIKQHFTIDENGRSDRLHNTNNPFYRSYQKSCFVKCPTCKVYMIASKHRIPEDDCSDCYRYSDTRHKAQYLNDICPIELRLLGRILSVITSPIITIFTNQD